MKALAVMPGEEQGQRYKRAGRAGQKVPLEGERGAWEEEAERDVHVGDRPLAWGAPVPVGASSINHTPNE